MKRIAIYRSVLAVILLGVANATIFAQFRGGPREEGGSREDGSSRERRRGREERRREESKPAESPRPGTGSPTASASSSSKSSAAKGSSGVPGFGTGESTGKVPGFDVPLLSATGIESRYDKRILDHVATEILPKYDKNKNDMIEFDEASDGRWDPPLADSDLDHDKSLSKLELYERYAKKFRLPPKGGDLNITAMSAGSKNAATPAASDANKFKEYAQGLLRQYDENKSGVLEKNEWEKMKADYHAADVNKDSVITQEELAAKLAGYASTPSPTTVSSTPSGSSSTTSKKWWQKDREGSSSSATGVKAAEKKTYRFLSPTERLPKGLPDWFARNDADGDGQVGMSEYTTTWSESAVAEFEKYDRNRDGVITADECLEVETQGKKK